MIEGYFYLHENNDLIYKNDPDSIVDIRESDLCVSAWAWDGQRQTAWSILVEANALGARKERIKELAERWGCDNKDAMMYASYLGIDLTKHETDVFIAKLSIAKFGAGLSYLDAMSALAMKLGYKGGKMWNATFETLIKEYKSSIVEGGA